MFSEYDKIPLQLDIAQIPSKKIRGGLSYEKMKRLVDSKKKTWSQVLLEHLPSGNINGLWMCSEKVHGSNLCFVLTFDEETSMIKTIQPARRRDVLKDDEEYFYGWKELFTRYHEKLTTIGTLIKEKETTFHPTQEHISAILIYGEFFGGGYPGIEPIDEYLKPIQLELLYRSDLEFYGFDIAIKYFDNNNNPEEKYYLSYLQTSQFFDKAGFQFWNKPLLIGSREECEHFPIQSYHSTVTCENGKSNIEGIVIRALFEKTLTTKEERLIYKKKTQLFLETVDKGQDKIDNMLTLPRLTSVISKLGRISESRKLELINAFVQDVVEEDSKDISKEILFMKAKEFIDRNKSKWISSSEDKKKCKD